jgi:ABC-type Zn uptake system ZnuABC Zn-binding protein ZnuA
MKNILLYPLVFLLCIGFTACTHQKQTESSPQISTTEEERKIPIVTTNEILSIHTRMIAQKNAFVITLGMQKKSLSKADKTLLYESAAILSDSDIQGSPLEKIVEKYDGKYAKVAATPLEQTPEKLSDTIATIERIRDTLSEIDPDRRGTYFDNAGDYVYLLSETYQKLSQRLQEYHQKDYTFIGSSLDDFLTDIDLKKHMTLRLEEDDTEKLAAHIEAQEKVAPLSIIISQDELSPKTKALAQKMKLETYVLPNLSDDTSEWWYIRFIEKMVQPFIAAYDTYD